MVSVTDGQSDGIESSNTHILSEPKGGSSCDADCLGRPPLSLVRHSFKASHEEVAPKVHIEIMKVNVLLLQVLVGGWDEHLMKVLPYFFGFWGKLTLVLAYLIRPLISGHVTISNMNTSVIQQLEVYQL